MFFLVDTEIIIKLKEYHKNEDMSSISRQQNYRIQVKWRVFEILLTSNGLVGVLFKFLLRIRALDVEGIVAFAHSIT